MTQCCPTCQRPLPREPKFTAAEEVEIARLHLKERVKQTYLARWLGCEHGTISKIVARAASMVYQQERT
jgi:hypothetical protein